MQRNCVFRSVSQQKNCTTMQLSIEDWPQWMGQQSDWVFPLKVNLSASPSFTMILFPPLYSRSPTNLQLLPHFKHHLPFPSPSHAHHTSVLPQTCLNRLQKHLLLNQNPSESRPAAWLHAPHPDSIPGVAVAPQRPRTQSPVTAAIPSSAVPYNSPSQRTQIPNPPRTHLQQSLVRLPATVLVPASAKGAHEVKVAPRPCQLPFARHKNPTRYLRVKAKLTCHFNFAPAHPPALLHLCLVLKDETDKIVAPSNTLPVSGGGRKGNAVSATRTASTLTTTQATTQLPQDKSFQESQPRRANLSNEH